MVKKVLVTLASGSEEIECVAVIDILRRAGIDVVVASCDQSDSLVVFASRGVKIQADCLLSDCIKDDFDMVVLPGGLQGAEILSVNRPLINMLSRRLKDNLWIAAICAAPAVVLANNGLLESKQATCHPAFADILKRRAKYKNSSVVIDEPFITSVAPGTAIEFSLSIVEILLGKSAASDVAEPLCI